MNVRNRWFKAIQALIDRNKSIKKTKVTFIGEDHLGNKYYEAHRPNHQWRPIQRFYEKKSYEGIKYVADVVDVPPAWSAWLRFRRKDPPTELEINESDQYYKAMQEKDANNKSKESNTTMGGPKLPWAPLKAKR